MARGAAGSQYKVDPHAVWGQQETGGILFYYCQIFCGNSETSKAFSIFCTPDTTSWHFLSNCSLKYLAQPFDDYLTLPISEVSCPLSSKTDSCQAGLLSGHRHI